MSKKQDQYYYKCFVEGIEFSCKAAELLAKTIEHFKADELEPTLEEMHNIEHSADIKKHEMMSKLVKEFITPLEREDIIELSQTIDDVTDSIEDILLRLYMFNATSIRKEASEFCKLIVSCCTAMKKMMEEFPSYAKSAVIHDLIVEVNRLEEVGDKLYTSAMRSLYTSSSDPVEIVAWSEIFNLLEKCCDNCEDVANVVESVIMKNS